MRIIFGFGAILALCLSACGAAAPPLPTPLPPEAPPTPAAVSSLVVVQHFDVARERELTVVLHSDVTAQQINAIEQADTKAREVLRAMGRQGAYVTSSMLRDARAAVRALEAALDP